MKILKLLFTLLIEILIAFCQFSNFFLQTIVLSLKQVDCLLFLLKSIICLGNQVTDRLSNFTCLLIHHFLYDINHWYFNLLPNKIDLIFKLFSLFLVEPVAIKIRLLAYGVFISTLSWKLILFLTAPYLQIIFVVRLGFLLELNWKVLLDLFSLWNRWFFIEFVCKNALSEFSAYVVTFWSWILIVVFVYSSAWERSFSKVFGRSSWAFNIFIKTSG